MPDNLEENSSPRDALGRLLPGSKLNPHGRPKGQSMKEFWKKRFANMTDEQKEQWCFDNKVSPDIIWRMAEGQPKQSVDGGEDEEGKPLPILGGVSLVNVQPDNSTSQDNSPQQAN